MTFVPFTDPSGNPVAVNPLAVSLVKEVPGTGGLQSFIDLADPSLPRVVVLGTTIVVATALGASGEIGFAPFAELGTGLLLGVNVGRVAAVYPAPGGTFLDFDDTSLARVAVIGNQAATLVLLASANVPQPGSANYTPIMAASGGGVVSSLNGWRALRIGQQVHLIGQLNFVPFAGGVPETITIDLAPPAPFPAPAPFAFIGDATGGASVGDGVTMVPQQPRASVGTLMVDLVVTAAAAGATLGVVIQYATA